MAQGDTKIIAAIRKLVLEADELLYERQRADEQAITFASAAQAFSQAEAAFDETQYETFGLTDADRAFTHLALLLSDQCAFAVRVAVFRDVTQQQRIGARDFGGSLFEQVGEVSAFLDTLNKTTETFEKYERVNRRDYPEEAIREALLNAMLHREYTVNGSILVKVFSDRMEFVSPGGLTSGWIAEDVMSGWSACRNPGLMAVFVRLGLAVAAGTGMAKIWEAYKGSSAQPKVEVTANVFKLVLPNRNNVKAKGAANAALTPEENIREFLQDNGSINRKQAEQLLGMSQTAAGLVLRGMVESNELTREGHSRNIRYFVSKY